MEPGPTAANDGKTPYERFYDMKPDVGHMRTFGSVVKVTPPLAKLGKLEDQESDGLHARIQARRRISRLGDEDVCTGEQECGVLGGDCLIQQRMARR